MTCGSNPGFWMVTEMSALRFTTTEQGVTQVVGFSSPEMMASAPEGVDAMLRFSVVPRVTDAQPTARAHSAIIPKIRIQVPPNRHLAQPEAEGKGGQIPESVPA